MRSTRVARGSDKHSVQARALVVGLAKTTANAAWRQRAEVMAQATPHNPGRPTAGAATAPAQAEQAVTTAGAADALGARVEAAVAAQVGPNSALAPLHPPPPPPSEPAAQAVVLEWKTQVQFQPDRTGRDFRARAPGVESTLWSISLSEWTRSKFPGLHYHCNIGHR